MNVEKVAEFPPIAMESFLAGSDFGRELLAGKTSEFGTFRVRCREFLDRLIVVILKSPSASSRVSRGFYSFCPELLLEGDGQLVFRLFSDLCRILESCGALLSDESKAAVEEFSSYVVEKRSQHEASTGVASEIPDVVSLLLRDFGFQARVHGCRVLKLCVLITGRPRENYPAVTFDLSGSKLSEKKFRECLLLVQSYVLSPGYAHKCLLIPLWTLWKRQSPMLGCFTWLRTLICGRSFVVELPRRLRPVIRACTILFYWVAASPSSLIMLISIRVIALPAHCRVRLCQQRVVAMFLCQRKGRALVNLLGPLGSQVPVKRLLRVLVPRRKIRRSLRR